MSRSSRRTGSGILLLILVAVTGLGAMAAGVALIIDPSGASMALSTDMLHRGPFADFVVPGLFLLVVLGLGALPVLRGLWSRSPWAGSAALAYAVVLLAWITVQAVIIGIISPLQPLFGTLGLLMVASALWTQKTG